MSAVNDCLGLWRLTENPLRVARFKKVNDPARSVEVKFRDGRSLRLRGGHRDFHIFNRIFLRDSYRVEELHPPLECILDIGANVGIFSCRAAPLAKRVLAYEAWPANHAVLAENVRPYENVIAHCMAVCGKPGTLRLFEPEDPHCSGQASIYETVDGFNWQRSEEIEATTLNAIFHDNNISQCEMMKIDVEGAEYEILYAADKEVLGAIGRICGEFHLVENGAGDANIESLLKYLEGAGFKTETSDDKRKPGHGLFFATRRS